jgi:hypothetical protein
LSQLKLAVIGTFYGRHENTFPLMHRLFVDGSRPADEVWLIGETLEDVEVIDDALDELYNLEALENYPETLRLMHLKTPMIDGKYAVIPYSHKINYALDRTKADVIVYLDNGSMPGPEKYKTMIEGLEEHPEWGAVYCTQKRTGYQPTIRFANDPVEDAYCDLNYTQVMHRLTEDRWSLDMRDADPDLADGLFWRALHKSLGAFHPVGGVIIHDDHYIPSPKAVGV